LDEKHRVPQRSCGLRAVLGMTITVHRDKHATDFRAEATRLAVYVLSQASRSLELSNAGVYGSRRPCMQETQGIRGYRRDEPLNLKIRYMTSFTSNVWVWVVQRLLVTGLKLFTWKRLTEAFIHSGDERKKKTQALFP
jgi:hypothetical protein